MFLFFIDDYFVQSNSHIHKSSVGTSITFYNFVIVSLLLVLNARWICQNIDWNLSSLSTVIYNRYTESQALQLFYLVNYFPVIPIVP
jgi:hypothetical protein